MKSEIENTLKNYLQACYTQDFDTMLELLDTDSTLEYKNQITSFAEKMDVFGETEDFLRKLKIENLEELKKMSVKDFMLSIFKLITREVGKKDLKKMIDGTKIIQIEEIDYLTNVKYEIHFKMFGEWNVLPSEVNMIFTEGNWRLLFKSGLEMAFEGFQKEIDLYYERKSKDKLSNLQFEGDLTKYTLVGYKNIEGDVVFEARFKDAGEFNQGLAYVQVMKKYGYINLKGDLAIKPQFQDAHDFSKRRAAVKVRTNDGNQWGFINKRGKMVIPAQYDSVSYFSKGMCAVEQNGKWGYINKKGETVIPFQFESAEAFEFGSAFVTIKNSSGEIVEMSLNKKGELLD